MGGSGRKCEPWPGPFSVQLLLRSIEIAYNLPLDNRTATGYLYLSLEKIWTRWIGWIELDWIGWDWNGNKINSGIVYCSIWSTEIVCNDLNIIILMLEGVQMWMLALG